MSDSATGAPEIERPREETYFEYSATLRIFGEIPSIDGLTQRLGVRPSHAHLRGEKRSPRSRPNEHDMWMYQASVPSTEPLHVHIDELWSVFKGQKDDLLQLKKEYAVDVFLGYRSNSDNAGVEVPAKSLEMFVELEVPFGLSIIIA